MSKVKNISGEMAKILDEYQAGLKGHLERVSSDTAKETAEKLKDVSPRRTGAYAEGWTARATRTGWVTYNRDHYRLTHLLEHGHVLVSYGKTRGRVPAKPHIAPVAREMIDEYMSRLKRYER